MRLIIICITLALTLDAALADDHMLTGEMILDGLDMSPEERRRLAAGEVVAMDGEDWESTPRELAADATVLVHKSLDDVLEQVREVPSIIPQKYLIEYGDIDADTAFDGVGYTLDEYEHADNFLQAKVGKEFNLSNEEVAEIRRFAAGANSKQQRVEAASRAMRHILRTRFASYRADGLAGVAPYQRSKKKAISIGDELRVTTETFKPFSEYYADYYRVLHDYPDGADCCDHVFRWLKARIKKKPTFALSHTIIQRHENYLLVTERHYYVSALLNSVQVTVSWVPWDEDTQMGLAVSASTDVLDSLLGKMLRGLGRNKARDLVGDVLTEIRDDLQQPEP